MSVSEPAGTLLSLYGQNGAISQSGSGQIRSQIRISKFLFLSYDLSNTEGRYGVRSAVPKCYPKY